MSGLIGSLHSGRDWLLISPGDASTARLPAGQRYACPGTRASRPPRSFRGKLFLSRIAVFDPFSGASGDMILGALLDAGVPLTSIQDAVSRLGIEGVRITSRAASSGAI